MKIKKIYVLAIILTIIAALLSFCACGDEEETFNNISCSPTKVIYAGEQTITLTSVAPIGEGEAARFKESISASDLTLKDALAGKTVSAVEFVSETEISVTLSGTASRVPTGDEVADIGRIYVSSAALSSNGGGYCLVTVTKPMLKLEETKSAISNGKRILMSRYALQSGSFTTSAESLIALRDGNVGTLTVEINGSEIKFTVSISETSVTSVEVIIPAAATSLNKQITVKVGTYDSVEL